MHRARTVRTGMTLKRRILGLPLATLLGAAAGVLIALVASVVAYLSSEQEPSLVGFGLAPIPAAYGLWIDWARLYKPTRRTRFWSFAFLFLATFAGIEAGLVAREVGPGGLALGPAIPAVAAVVIGLGAQLLLFVSRRGREMFGFGVVCGEVRRDESDRILLDAPEGLVDIGRRESEELGSRRLVDVATGAPLAVLARLRTSVENADPFRTEGRKQATPVLAVDSSPSRLRQSIERRARAWFGYLFVLALGASALGATMSRGGDVQDAPCARGCLVKSW